VGFDRPAEKQMLDLPASPPRAHTTHAESRYHRCVQEGPNISRGSALTTIYFCGGVPDQRCYSMPREPPLSTGTTRKGLHPRNGNVSLAPGLLYRASLFSLSFVEQSIINQIWLYSSQVLGKLSNETGFLRTPFTKLASYFSRSSIFHSRTSHRPDFLSDSRGNTEYVLHGLERSNIRAREEYAQIATPRRTWLGRSETHLIITQE